MAEGRSAVISYGAYQKLPNEEKALYDLQLNSDGKSGVAKLKSANTSTPKAATVPTQEMSDASKTQTKTVMSKKEATDAGFSLIGIPKESDLGKPGVSDAKGYIDKDGNYHANSKATEARSAAAAKDLSTGATYKTAKAPSAYELDLRNRTLGGKDTKGNYVHSEQDLRDIIAKYGKDDPELKKAAEEELAKRKKSSGSGGPVGSNLGGRTTDQWVKWMVDQGYTREEIEAAYAKEGYSKDGKLFKAAMDKYYKDKSKEPEPTPSGISTDDPTEDLSTKANAPEGPKDPEDPTDIRKFSKDLNRFVIQAYLNGQFGKKSDPNAIATMGYFILDKIGNALVNASQVARGLTPTAKSEWSKLLDKQTDLMGKRITAEWFNSLSPAEQSALLKTGGVTGTTAATLNENVSDTSDKTREMDMKKRELEISKLTQEQKAVAQGNLNALLVRKTELQSTISKLKSDQGWDSYMQAMNAYVGTARGLNTIGATNSTQEGSTKGWSDTFNINVGAGKIPANFVAGGIDNTTTWNNSSAKNIANSSSLNKDAFAYSRFQNGESYAKAGAKAQKEANQELIAKLESQIKVIDKCIAEWGKELGIGDEK